MLAGFILVDGSGAGKVYAAGGLVGADLYFVE